MVLAGYMFGGPITSHVSDRIRNREGLSYGANARLAVPTEGDSAMLSGTVSLNPANGPKVEFSFKDELAKTLKEGFNAKEVAEAKKAYPGFADGGALAGCRAAGRAWLRMSSMTGRMAWDEQLEAKIAALTPAQISEAFRRHVDAAVADDREGGGFQGGGGLSVGLDTVVTRSGGLPGTRLGLVGAGCSQGRPRRACSGFRGLPGSRGA